MAKIVRLLKNKKKGKKDMRKGLKRNHTAVSKDSPDRAK